MWKKVLSVTLASVLGLSSFAIAGGSSVKAASSVTTNVAIQQEATETRTEVKKDITIDQDKVVETMGVKGYLVKLAISTIKVSIDKGGSVLNYILKWFDKDTAKYFNNNKGKIVKALDQLEDWIDDASDITQSAIKTKLNSLLRAAGVPSTYSLAIADAIARTVTWLLL